MAYYPPYPNIYQPGLYQQMGQPQSPMIMQGQQMPNAQQMPMQNQPMQQAMQSQMQPVQPSFSQQSNSMIWVSSKEEADRWPVIAGNAVALWDSTAAVVYLRQADNTGKPSTEVYDLVKRTDEKPEPQATKIDLSQYMKISDAEEMIDKRVNDILAERLKKPVNGRQKKEEE